MNSETAAIANSTVFLLAAGAVILIVVLQALIFLAKAWRRGRELGISNATMKKVATNAAVFTIVPSLPIIIIMSVLMPPLGKVLPWLRLSILGSAMYETFAADTTVKTFGLMSLTDTGITPAIFISILWVMTLGVIFYPLMNIFFLKRFDTTMTNLRKKGGFIELAIGAMFIGLMVAIGVPMLVNFKIPTYITTIFVSGIVVVLLEKMTDKTGISALKDFAFPLSMVIGMASAIFFNKIF